MSNGFSNSDLWKMRYLVNSSLHPDTKEPIPKMFRWSSFLYMNIPLAIGIAIFPNSMRNVVGWQSLNQAYNYGVNVCNGPAESKGDPVMLCLAVISSVFVAYFTDKLLANRFRLYSTNFAVNKVPALLGVSAANLVNLFYARFRDTFNGIQINEYASGKRIPGLKSKIAAKKAFWMCAFSHMVLPISVIMTPAIIIHLLRARNKMPTSFFGKSFLNITASGFGLMVGLPMTMACFPQQFPIHYSKLEPEFAKIHNENGERIEIFSFNKGT